MAERLLEHVVLLARIAELRGDLPLRLKRGLWKVVIGDWVVWCNPHRERILQQLTERGVDVPYGTFYVEYRNAPAGKLQVGSGTFADRPDCDADVFRKALVNRIVELEWLSANGCAEVPEDDLSDFPDIGLRR